MTETELWVGRYCRFTTRTKQRCGGGTLSTVYGQERRRKEAGFIIGACEVKETPSSTADFVDQLTDHVTDGTVNRSLLPAYHKDKAESVESVVTACLPQGQSRDVESVVTVCLPHGQSRDVESVVTAWLPQGQSDAHESASDYFRRSNRI